MIRQESSPVLQKFGASAINASCASLVASPFAMYGFESWRLAVLVVFFLGGVCYRQQCIGCLVMGTRPNQPANLLYIALYTLGLSTCFYWVLVPFDLLLINATMQVICLRVTGMTVHGWLAGVYTVQVPQSPSWEFSRQEWMP